MHCAAGVVLESQYDHYISSKHFLKNITLVIMFSNPRIPRDSEKCTVRVLWIPWGPPDDPKWSQRSLPDDPRWSQIIPNDPRRAQVIRDDPRWPQMIPDDPRCLSRRKAAELSPFNVHPTPRYSRTYHLRFSHHKSDQVVLGFRVLPWMFGLGSLFLVFGVVCVYVLKKTISNWAQTDNKLKQMDTRN